jgi:hypothetical protein
MRNQKMLEVESTVIKGISILVTTAGGIQNKGRIVAAHSIFDN